MLRFLHAADLHLCSPLAAFSTEHAALRRNRQFDALEQLFSIAVKRGAQMILLAGDVFDTPYPDENGAARFFAICDAQPVPVIVAPGNHDRYCEGGVWQREMGRHNAYVFDRDSLGCFDFPTLGAAVYGYAFRADSMEAPYLGSAADLREGRVSVLLAHADLQSPFSSYAPISSGQLERAGFAYAALGHIHKAPAPVRCGSAVAAYSGFFAGRGFDEVGGGSALLVEIEDGRVSLQRLESEADRFEITELCCDGDQNNEEIYTRLRGYLQNAAFSPYTALRVRLTGNVGLSCYVDTARLLSLGQGLSLFELRDETLPIHDGAYLEKDPTMKGAFYRALLPQLSSADAEERALAAEALRLGLAALSGKEV